MELTDEKIRGRKVSIIIPVYNAENFLDRCMENVITQTYSNIEILLINDGSTDNSGSVCGRYALDDKRIKVINQENKGPASARNAGIKNASGEFVFFLDADDFIEKNTIEILIKNYNQYNPDLVMSNFSKFEKDNLIRQKPIFSPGGEIFEGEIKILSKPEIKEYIRHFLKTPSNHLISYCWARLYKLSIIKENNIFANEDMKLFEDFVFNLEYLKYVDKIVFVNESLYNYVLHETHLSASMSILNSDSLTHDMNIFKSKIIGFFQDRNIEKEIGHCLIHYAIIFLVRSCKSINNENKEKIYREIEKFLDSSIIKENLEFYFPSKGNSKVLPDLMKSKEIGLLMFICSQKAYKRYGGEEKLPVIISGAGVVGGILLKLCEEEGIEIECFCDSSKKVIQSDFCGKEVIYTPELKTRYKDAVILISVAAIKDVVDLLERIGFSKWHAGGILLKNFDISQNKALIDSTKYSIENCVLCHLGYLNPDKLFLRSVDLIITERCSLRCKDCSNLMQYYQNPKNCDIDMIFKSIDVFLSLIDEIMDFRVIGGDSFMNPEWSLVVNKLVDEPKVKRVVLYTNGTIIPREESLSCLKNKKVFVIISDYKEISRNLNKLKEIFEKNNINYGVLDVEEWLDCAKIKQNNRGVEGNKEIYKLCCAKNMLTLSDGKLFRCPYAANAHRLHAVPDYKEDYVDIFEDSVNENNLQQIKNKIKEYVLNKDYLEICDFCNGRPLSGVEVEPSVQISKPLEYKEYS